MRKILFLACKNIYFIAFSVKKGNAEGVSGENFSPRSAGTEG